MRNPLGFRQLVDLIGDGAQQLIFREGLGQVLLRSNDTAACPIEQSVLAGQHDDGCFFKYFVVLDQGARLVAVQTRHHDVNEDEIRLMVGDLRQRVETVERRRRFALIEFDRNPVVPVLGQKVAISAGSYYQGSALDDGRFGFYGAPREEHTLDEIEAIIRQELKKVIETGITEEELARAKRSMIADAIYAQDSQQSLARIFGSALATGQSVETVQNWPAQLEAVTLADVQNAARTFLSGPPVIGELTSAPETPAPADNEEKS